MNREFEAFDEAVDNGFWTASYLKMLVSVYLRGCKVVRSKQTPVESMFGQVRYKRTWLLQASESE